MTDAPTPRAALNSADPAGASQQVAARAWDEGYARGTRDAEMDYEPADNPYRADRIAGAET